MLSTRSGRQIQKQHVSAIIFEYASKLFLFFLHQIYCFQACIRCFQMFSFCYLAVITCQELLVWSMVRQEGLEQNRVISSFSSVHIFGNIFACYHISFLSCFDGFSTIVVLLFWLCCLSYITLVVVEKFEQPNLCYLISTTIILMSSTA